MGFGALLVHHAVTIFSGYSYPILIGIGCIAVLLGLFGYFNPRIFEFGRTPHLLSATERIQFWSVVAMGVVLAIALYLGFYRWVDQ